jgi:hypothetical protein
MRMRAPVHDPVIAPALVPVLVLVLVLVLAPCLCMYDAMHLMEKAAVVCRAGPKMCLQLAARKPASSWQRQRRAIQRC